MNFETVLLQSAVAAAILVFWIYLASAKKEPVDPNTPGADGEHIEGDW